MTWSQLLAKREVSPHTTSRQEIENLRALIARDLQDASIAALSADRRFPTAYNAALQTATIAIACSGYRVTARAGHHAVSFEGASLAVGAAVAHLTDYFDICRRKRNSIDYQNISVATDTEADELLRNAAAFHTLVEAWVAAKHPTLATR